MLSTQINAHSLRIEVRPAHRVAPRPPLPSLEPAPSGPPGGLRCGRDERRSLLWLAGRAGNALELRHGAGVRTHPGPSDEAARASGADERELRKLPSAIEQSRGPSTPARSQRAVLLTAALAAAASIGCRAPMSATATTPLQGDIVGTVAAVGERERAELVAAMRAATPPSFVTWEIVPPATIRWSDLPAAVRAAAIANDAAVARADVQPDRAVFRLLTLDGRPGWLEVRRVAATTPQSPVAGAADGVASAANAPTAASAPNAANPANPATAARPSERRRHTPSDSTTPALPTEWIASVIIGDAVRQPEIERAILDALRRSLAAPPRRPSLDWIEPPRSAADPSGSTPHAGPPRRRTPRAQNSGGTGARSPRAAPIRVRGRGRGTPSEPTAIAAPRPLLRPVRVPRRRSLRRDPRAP